jgi:hypothetical protein
MLRCVKWLLALALLAAIPAWAQDEEPRDPMAGLADWLTIPGFAVEAAVGSGVRDNGALVGEATRFAENVGAVYCRVDAIGLEGPQNVAIVWYREDEERARAPLRLTREKPNGSAMMTIPAAQAGTWRVEVQDAGGQVLTVVPFVVGKATRPDDGQRKQAPRPQ